ncbi:hypothetical protein Pmani_017275 [Petrolisthes manimaculis]|uniref:Uncharacterized protein n=1 Tax=Petrolisthes manimaculis TaxID=1843537 RepID=A0AAE1PQI2_9EUCA|nr:hypothetical protein Pmani_017275 [Petrolisthes manimaculis]
MDGHEQSVREEGKTGTGRREGGIGRRKQNEEERKKLVGKKQGGGKQQENTVGKGSNGNNREHAGKLTKAHKA